MKLSVAQVLAASLIIGVIGACTGQSYCQTNAPRQSPTSKPSPSQSLKSIPNVNAERSNVNLQAVTPSPETTPEASNLPLSTQVLSLIVNALLALSTILFLYLTYRMSKKRSDAENKLDKAREYIRALSVIDYIYQDIVLFGPRDSGKTSVAKLWTEPAFDIEDLPYTEAWNLYERDILEFNEKAYEKHHQGLNVDIKYKPRLRIRVHDYPGENRFRLEAVNRLPQLQHAVFLFFFAVQADSKGVHTVHDNNSYYSQAFIDSIRRQQDNDLRVSKVVVVFNKADLLPASIDLEQAKAMLKQCHEDAINRIEGQFSGKLEYIVVSARDNRGLISLLGAAGSSTLPSEVKKRFDETISKIALQPKK